MNDTGCDRLTLEQIDSVGILTIENETKRNALDPGILGAIERALELAVSRELRVAILRGAGTRLFSSGYDIESILDAAGQDISIAPLNQAMRAVERCPIPVIAMVFGGAYGAGCELVAACDLRFATSNSRFAIPAAKLGVVYSAEGLTRLSRAAGPTFARELLLTARPMEASRAYDLGLLNGLYSTDELESSVLKLAEEMAALAPRSLHGTKEILRALDRGVSLPHGEQQRFDAMRDAAMASEDFKEGRRAFAEKRSPRFGGR